MGNDQVMTSISSPSPKMKMDIILLRALHKVIRQIFAITMPDHVKLAIVSNKYRKTIVQYYRESYHLGIFEDLKFSQTKQTSPNMIYLQHIYIFSLVTSQQS